MTRFLLASSSTVRASLLRNAALDIFVEPARIDEEGLRASLALEDAPPRDVADILAEQKAAKIARKHPSDRVLGCDQILSLDGAIIAKAPTVDAARRQLLSLRGRTHLLYSAAVLFENGQPVWREVAQARMTMRDFSDAFLDDYLDRYWHDVRDCVGCYRIEGPGIRLFSAIDGSWPVILGLPLMELLAFLTQRGTLPR